MDEESDVRGAKLLDLLSEPIGEEAIGIFHQFLCAATYRALVSELAFYHVNAVGRILEQLSPDLPAVTDIAAVYQTVGLAQLKTYEECVAAVRETVLLKASVFYDKPFTSEELPDLKPAMHH